MLLRSGKIINKQTGTGIIDTIFKCGCCSDKLITDLYTNINSGYYYKWGYCRQCNLYQVYYST